MPINNKHKINKRRIIEDLKDVEKYTRQTKTEPWLYRDGGKRRYKEIYVEELKNKVLNFILNDLKKNPEIIILGPGIGHDTAILKRELESYGINPQIDVFNLTKFALDESLLKQKIIRNDYSKQFLAFEKINEIEHATLVKKIKHKYDIFVAPASVGRYTNSVPYALFQTSLILNKGGRGYIECVFIDRKGFDEIKIAQRMLAAYNKTAKEKVKIDLKILKETLSEATRVININQKEYVSRSVWVEVRRKE